MLYSGYCCDKCKQSIEYEGTINDWLPSKTHLVKFARKKRLERRKKCIMSRL